MTDRRTRRAALASVGFVGLAGMALAGFAKAETVTAQIPTTAPAGDAELLALIAEFNHLEQTVSDVFDNLGPDDPDEAFEAANIWPLVEKQEPLFERIMKIRATTLEGYRARAKMFFLWEKELEAEAQEDAPEPGGWPERMRWALVRDLIGEDA